jgi:hypothetical protein
VVLFFASGMKLHSEFHSIQIASGAHPFSYSLCAGGPLSPVIKRPVNEAKQSHLLRGGAYHHFYIRLHGVHREKTLLS